MEEIIMPALGLGMESGKIVSWLKEEGESVEKGEPLFEVETDKLTSEIESSASGTLLKILHEVGEDVPVNQPVGFVGAEGEEVPSSAGVSAPAAASAAAESAVGVTEPEGVSSTAASPSASDVRISPAARAMADQNNLDLAGVAGTGIGGRIVRKDLDGSGAAEGTRIFASPYARKLSKELGLDLAGAGIRGSAPGGRIISDDVLAWVESGKPGTAAGATGMPAATLRESASGAPAELKRETLSGMRKVIAERMTLSKTTIPHFGLRSVASADALVQFREEVKEAAFSLFGVKITYTDILVKICALALSKHPELNASLVGEECITYKDITVGIAVSLENGLVVPAIAGADTLGLAEICRKKDELIEKARTGSLSLEDLSGGTFTLTNLGMYRVRSASPVINPPQAAILAVGEIYREPAVIDGEVGIGSFMELSLACDHRLVDGVKGAEFLTTVVEMIEHPKILAL